MSGPVRLARACAVLALALTCSLPASAAWAGSGGPGSHGESRASRTVVLGDSYSSGEGTFVYEEGTDTATDMCHRSPLAYGPLLSGVDRRLRPLDFVACSGAQTRDLLGVNHTYPGEPAQVDAADRRTKTVMLTLGGNDVGFADIVASCLAGTFSPSYQCSENPLIVGTVAQRTAALAGRGTSTGAGFDYTIVPVADVLGALAAAAPRATIYVGGYPLLFGAATATYAADPRLPSGYGCVLNPAAGAVLDHADAQFLNASTLALNAALADSVRQARAAGVRAVYVAPKGFSGHGLCDRRASWIQPVLVDGLGRVRSESLHPTVRGQVAYATSFARAGVDGHRR